VTAVQPSAPIEPAPPQRGQTRERGRDINAAQAEAEAETSTVNKYFKMASPLFYVTVYPMLRPLFWPMRNYQKTHHPEEYTESQRKK
jgi:hypothetical protein